MNRVPLVSVIIPVFNRRDLVIHTLESVARQTYRNIEVIVVDNGSTDGSYERVEKWINDHSREYEGICFRVISEGRPGACSARNAGLKTAAGELINFFDSDDLMRPQLVEKAVRSFTENHEADLVCWKCELHFLNGKSRVLALATQNHMEYQLIHSILRPQGYMVKREFLNLSGNWDENLAGWNDWELGFRILLNNPRIVAIEEVLADIYAQKDSITGNDFSSKEGVWERSIAAVYEDESLFPHHYGEGLKDIITYREVILAAHYSKEGNKRGAERLKREALGKVRSWRKRMLLQFSYHYTRIGGRGAWKIIRGLYV